MRVHVRKTASNIDENTPTPASTVAVRSAVGQQQ